MSGGCRTVLRSPLIRGLLAVLVVGLFAGLLRAPLLSAGLAISPACCSRRTA